MQRRVAVIDRRQLILDAASELFATRGVAATTVRDIGDASGIQSGSLYHHFDSKESMVAEIVLGYLDALLAGYRAIGKHADPRTKLESIIRVTIDAVDRHRWGCAIYQNDYYYLTTLPKLAHIEQLNTEVHDFWVSAVRAGVKRGQFRADVDPDVFYRLAGHAVLASVRWFSSSKRYPTSRLADDAISVLLDGFTVTEKTRTPKVMAPKASTEKGNDHADD